jgi:hypothetical protein
MTVTCEAFGRFLDCFGPLIDEDKNIITKVRVHSLSLSLGVVWILLLL